MNKLKFCTALATTLLLATISMAEMKDHSMHEKCKVVDGNGKNLVKANKADGVNEDLTKARMNAANEEGAWVWVPKGWCNVLNDWAAKGELSVPPQEVSNALKDPKTMQSTKELWDKLDLGM